MGKEEDDLKRCEAFKKHALDKDPAVQFMMRALQRGGCDMAASKVVCRQCTCNRAGGFQTDGGIELCANHLTTQAHASTTLVHEAVHAFDACRARIDWGNCVHHACTEIRAARLSGDCAFWREVLLRGNVGFARQFQRCVKRRAEISVAMNPSCDKLAARNAVKDAWPSCYDDTAPFDAHTV